MSFDLVRPSVFSKKSLSSVCQYQIDMIFDIVELLDQPDL